MLHKLIIVNGNRSVNGKWSALLSQQIFNYVVQYYASFEAEIINVSDIDMPIFQKELWASPGVDIQNIKTKVVDSLGVIFVFPEYHGTIPAALKNLLEYFDEDMLKNKVCFLCCHNGGIHSLSAISHMHDIIGKMGGLTYPKCFCVDKTVARSVLTDAEEIVLYNKLSLYLKFLRMDP